MFDSRLCREPSTSDARAKRPRHELRTVVGAQIERRASPGKRGGPRPRSPTSEAAQDLDHLSVGLDRQPSRITSGTSTAGRSRSGHRRMQSGPARRGAAGDRLRGACNPPSQSVHSVHTRPTAGAAEKDSDTPVAIVRILARQCGLSASAGPGRQRACDEGERAADSSMLRSCHRPQPIASPSLAANPRGHQSLAAVSFVISISRSRSATRFFSRAFSASTPVTNRAVRNNRGRRSPNSHPP